MKRWWLGGAAMLAVCAGALVADAQVRLSCGPAGRGRAAADQQHCECVAPFVELVVEGVRRCRPRPAVRRGPRPGPQPAVAPAAAPGVTGACPAGMVLIAGGDFAMGDGSEHSMAPRTVHVNTFCMDRTEVSVASYRACVTSGGCATEPNPHRNVRADYNLFCNWNRPNAESHPVNCVDWHQATAYCTSVGGRLPSEQEWEYAARGREGRVYAWGNAAPTGALANFCGDECTSYAASSGFNGWPAYPGHHDEYAFTAPVDSMTAGATPDGLLHMTGNVWEWTSTVNGNNRVGRGGGWDSLEPSWVRAASRLTYEPASRHHILGFRCARGVM